MKFLLCLLSILMLGSWAVLSGQSSFGVSISDVGFSDFISSLSEIYDVEFSYESDLLSDQLFSLETESPDLGDVLDLLIGDHDLEYLILDDEKILLREKLSRPPKAQVGRVVKIKCKDALTGTHVPSVAIGIKGTSRGVYSDDSGHATLSLPPRDQNIILSIHMLGYQSKDVELAPGQSSLDISMDLLPFSIEEVMVKDRTDLIKKGQGLHSVSLSSRSVTSLVSGISGFDIVREIQLLPGVVSFQDRGSGIKIRGGSEESSMMLIDDIPIYRAGHYYGLFSSAHPSYTQSATLYKNNLPLAYDGKSDGMLALEGPTLDTTNDISANLDLSFVTAALHTDIPLSDQLMLSLAGRSSIGNISEGGLLQTFTPTDQSVSSSEDFRLVNRRKLLSSTPDYGFYDFNGSLQCATSKLILDLSYYRSDDDLDDLITNEFKSRSGRDLVINREIYDNQETWLNQGFNLGSSFSFSPTTSLSTQLYSTAYDNISTVGITLQRETRRATRELDRGTRRENFVRDYGIKSELQNSLPFGDLDIGIEVVHHDTRFELFEDDSSVRLIGNEAFESALFITYSPRINDKLDIDIGARGTQYQNKIYPAPRLSLSYQVQDELTTKLSLGRHNQYVRYLTYENPFGRSLNVWYQADNRGIEVGNTDHVMLGLNYQKDRWSLDIEGYYKKRYNLLEQALVQGRFTENTIFPNAETNNNAYQLFTGEGQTLGVDLLLSYTQPKYAGWLSYTLSKSTINFDQIFRGSSFPTQDDRRHQLDLVGQYFLGDFTFSATMVYASGRPYTDLDKVLSNLDRNQLRPEDRLSRLPSYIRGDVGVSYRLDLPSTSSLDIGFSVYNVMNRKNVNYIQYLFSIPSNQNDQPDQNENTLLGAESNLLGRTFNLSLSYSF